LQASIEKYEQEVNRFRSLYEQPKELAGRLESIENPYFEKRAMAQLEKSEKDWLDKIYNNCRAAGIEFNQRLLYSFHTALKTADWSPITVLAGVSGTGKSLLPEYYSRFGGIYFMSMAVQPDWDSPQSLFGYFNSVDNRFNATTLIRAMVQFSSKANQVNKDSNLSDAMFIVLLDEMNLAHVELYFSDMLSKLERRRNSDDEIDVEIDLGAGMPKYLLELTDSILWVGTMNEDETTKSLSDKVLDRGNLLSFPRPKEFISRSKANHVEAAQMLPKSVWQGWLDANVIAEEEFTSRIGKYKKGLEDINGAMEFAGRALGHRVWQSIENYMANHPKVIAAIKAEKFDDTKCELAMQEAFEEALVHKVMPKLRGIETDGETKIKCIDEIKKVLFGQNGSGGLAPGLEADFKHATENAYESFIWSSAKYLEIEE
jgi:5-methylcytosine-specific restriction endonuclease McrBC GTP-binding regulatory subunit McrB